MANHLTLNQTHFELDDKNNLTIWSNGKSVRIPASEVWRMLEWLNREQKEKLRTQAQPPRKPEDRTS